MKNKYYLIAHIYVLAEEGYVLMFAAYQTNTDMRRHMQLVSVLVVSSIIKLLFLNVGNMQSFSIINKCTSRYYLLY